MYVFYVNIDSAQLSYKRYFNHDKIITTWLPYRVNYPKSELNIPQESLTIQHQGVTFLQRGSVFPIIMMLKLLPKLWSIGRGSLFYKSVKVYGTPYLPYNVYLHYLWWFFIICRGYIIIHEDLLIIIPYLVRYVWCFFNSTL